MEQNKLDKKRLVHWIGSILLVDHLKYIFSRILVSSIHRPTGEDSTCIKFVDDHIHVIGYIRWYTRQLRDISLKRMHEEHNWPTFTNKIRDLCAQATIKPIMSEKHFENAIVYVRKYDIIAIFNYSLW